MKNNQIVIGTRKSGLALIQSHHVQALLRERHPGLDVQIRHIVTKGDKILDVPLARIGDKGLFTKELENALLDGSIDLAVHSYKDLPTRLPGGLAVGAVLKRERNNDALIAAPGTTLENLPDGARVGTSSLRRRSQLLFLRPGLDISDLRGNVNTRVDKFLAGQYDALVLAFAGILRMGLEKHIAEIIPFDKMLPAVSQGALAIEVREDDREVLDIVAFMNDAATAAATAAERAFLETLEGGCQVPIGAAAEVRGSEVFLRGLVASLDGSSLFRGEETGSVNNPAEAGQNLAARLLSQGADKVLEQIRTAQANDITPPEELLR
jgi:hydroxymethylbilane synthase